MTAPKLAKEKEVNLDEEELIDLREMVVRTLTRHQLEDCIEKISWARDLIQAFPSLESLRIYPRGEITINLKEKELERDPRLLDFLGRKWNE